MRERDEQAFQRKKAEIMEACFNCYAENGLTGTGIQALADACGLSKASLYTYFDTLDDLIVQSTAYCMSKVEDDFMRLAPTSPQDIGRFIDEVPYWTAKRHGKKYRLMYQVYTQMEPHLGIPCEVLTPLIFIFVRAAVHYALFEDEYYLKSQMDVLKLSVSLLSKQYRKEGQP